MKKLIIFVVSLISFVIFYYFSQYSKYSTTVSCVEIIEYSKEDAPEIVSQLLDNKNKCLKIDTQKIEQSGPMKDEAGIKYSIFFVQPEKKNDEHLGKMPDDIADEVPAEKKETNFSPNIKLQASDITIVFISIDESQGFTNDEILESVISAQTLYPDVDFTITDGFQIPEDRIIRESVTRVDTMNKSSVITINYEIILDEKGKPFLIKTGDVRFKYPDTGKKKKM